MSIKVFTSEQDGSYDLQNAAGGLTGLLNKYLPLCGFTIPFRDDTKHKTIYRNKVGDCLQVWNNHVTQNQYNSVVGVLWMRECNGFDDAWVVNGTCKPKAGSEEFFDSTYGLSFWNICNGYLITTNVYLRWKLISDGTSFILLTSNPKGDVGSGEDETWHCNYFGNFKSLIPGDSFNSVLLCMYKNDRNSVPGQPFGIESPFAIINGQRVNPTSISTHIDFTQSCGYFARDAYGDVDGEVVYLGGGLSDNVSNGGDYVYDDGNNLQVRDLYLMSPGGYRGILTPVKLCGHRRPVQNGTLVTVGGRTHMLCYVDVCGQILVDIDGPWDYGKE